MGNALLHGLPKKQLLRLQKLQNWAARLVVCAKKCDHVTPILRSLHWLPVESRSQFKILLLMFRCLNASAPSYLTDLLSIKEPVRNLRSCSQTSIYRIQRTKHSWGDRAFSIAAPRMWNHLPQNIKQSTSLANFKTLLKSHLFSKVYCTAL